MPGGGATFINHQKEGDVTESLKNPRCNEFNLKSNLKTDEECILGKVARGHWPVSSLSPETGTVTLSTANRPTEKRNVLINGSFKCVVSFVKGL